MEQAEPTSSPTITAPLEQPAEITYVPVWVKAIVATGVVLFAVQMPGFMASFSDAIQKSRAEKAYDEAQFTQAIARYKDLRSRYPTDNNLTKRLGFSYYRAGLYAESIQTFNQLAGVKMPKSEAEEINAAISEMAAKLDLKQGS